MRLLLWFAVAGAVCAAQQVDLGPHNIGGQGCMACHVVTSDPSGLTQYAWADGDPVWATASIVPQPLSIVSQVDEGWSHSARCLTCHDGVMAQVMDMGGIGFPRLPSAAGPHSVNVVYKPERGRLFPVWPVGGEWRLFNNPENPFTKLRLFRRSAFDPTPTVQCATCHDPHDHRNPYFLRDPYGPSFMATRFCRTCHAETSDYATLR